MAALFVRILFSLLLFSSLCAAGPRPLKILMPRMGSHPGFEPEWTRALEQFKSTHPEWPLQIVRRGEGMSALREVMASFLASDLPDLTLIEETELPALKSQELLRSFTPPENSLGLSVRWYPFVKTIPVLLANLSLTSHARPATFGELLREAKSAIQPKRHALLIPLQGPKGLWIFEALSAAPLWERTPGGLRSRRENLETISALQLALDTPGNLGQDETWEHALEGWIASKGVWLVTSLESLPLLRERARFAWSAQPLPPWKGGLGSMATGNGWIALSDHPGIPALMRVLYAPETAAQWITRGGLLPPTRTLQLSAAWKTEAHKNPQYEEVVQQALKLPLRSRSSDADLVRARSEWIQTLRKQLAPPSDRVPSDVAFVQLDTHLTRP